MAPGRGEVADPPAQGRDYLKLFMALCCLSAVGIAGSTYDSTLESDPDEIIDVKHDWLPIGKDKIQNFKNPDQSSTAGGGGGGGGSDPEPEPCTGGVVGFLATLLPSLIPPCGPFYLLGLLLPVVVVLVALSLLYRYRRRLIGPPLAVWGWLADLTLRSGDAASEAWPTEAPSTEVHAAWLTMVEQADVVEPWTRSPGECSRVAVDAGLESETVGTLTTLFEEVRYGDAPLTDERLNRAREYTKRLSDGRANHLTDRRGKSS